MLKGDAGGFRGLVSGHDGHGRIIGARNVSLRGRKGYASKHTRGEVEGAVDIGRSGADGIERSLGGRNGEIGRRGVRTYGNCGGSVSVHHNGIGGSPVDGNPVEDCLGGRGGSLEYDITGGSFSNGILRLLYGTSQCKCACKTYGNDIQSFHGHGHLRFTLPVKIETAFLEVFHLCRCTEIHRQCHCQRPVFRNQVLPECFG